MLELSIKRAGGLQQGALCLVTLAIHTLLALRMASTHFHSLPYVLCHCCHLCHPPALHLTHYIPTPNKQTTQ